MGGQVPGSGSGGTNPGSETAGSCFEIFPTLENAASDASPVVFHRNPLELNLGSVPVGTTAKVHISYFNFCADMKATMLGVELTETPAPGAAGASFAVTGATPAANALIGGSGTLDVAFTPKAAGLREARVRYKVSHGFYETRIKGGK